MLTYGIVSSPDYTVERREPKVKLSIFRDLGENWRKSLGGEKRGKEGDIV